MKTYCPTNPLQKNPEIITLQTALKHDKFYNGPLDGIFGPGTADACRRAKYRLGYPIKNVNHCGGQDLLNFLRGTTALPPEYVKRRHARGFGIDHNQQIREMIVGHARWGAANGSEIHYAQVRPMDHLNQVRVLPWWTDCSEFVTTIYKWAGAPDPNGMGYNGYGYTGSMLQAGRSLPLYQCKNADVVIWGGFPGHHTAVIVDMTDPNDPWIVSQGSENGPNLERLSWEQNAQGRWAWPTYKRYIRD